ncbi:hypothetical protein GCM10010145_44180 [Streptomyces ruber]|uniref:Uncharacterized protein n=2 Tax=Streptomyces TaxID=1883 RepID=A0A918BIB9_9ACTN|nr:hypothetical protein GCM10010145_44180 [Streptomyces ruber]
MRVCRVRTGRAKTQVITRARAGRGKRKIPLPDIDRDERRQVLRGAVSIDEPHDRPHGSPPTVAKGA